MEKYDQRIDRVKTRITLWLRDHLGTPKNAYEMFRIFSLFVRPHIREYEKFKVQTKACTMSHFMNLDVLGKGLANRVEGQKLKTDSESFRAWLNTQEICMTGLARCNRA